MTQRKGSISVNTNDILPIIKKWLYSEHDIFIRELVSNSCDAITKRSTLARNSNLELPTGEVQVIINKEAKTLTIKDNGLGMTEEEVEKYIAQLAFSGAKDFVEKMKDAGVETKEDIIGKFGLGFYSAFMVADKVEVHTLSMNEGSKPVKWTCEGDTEYIFEDGIKTDIGTEIVLHVSEDSKDFLELFKTRGVLTNYCQFMPFTVELVNANAEVKEGEEPTKDIINPTEPLWKKDPSGLKDEDYKDFFKKVFPTEEEPLFWIHLNVDHPFTLQGILYFPKLNPNKPVNESNIKLFSRQVFVSDNVKNIIPEFLGMLKGTIDSTDIPLNVSRSALQGDPNIKKISNYIIKKVADALKKLYRTDRPKYESVWADIGVFVKYGVISDEKFAELMTEMVLFKNSEENLVTLAEYKESVPKKYEEKMKNKAIYFEMFQSDQNLRKQLLAEGIHTIETDEYIDPHFMQHLEMKTMSDEVKKVQFISIDAEFENLLDTEDLTEDDNKVKKLFMDVFGIEDKEEDPKDFDPSKLGIEIKKLSNSTSPAYFKVDEQMKRFKQMTKSMGNTGLDTPIKKTLVINPNNSLVKNALKIWEKGEKKDLAEKICKHIEDLATVSSQGLDPKKKEGFVGRTQDLISELSNYVL